MFKQHAMKTEKTVTIDFEGTSLQVPETTTVAAAVLSQGGGGYIRHSPVTGEKRAPYCFMGVCHECLVEIDGVHNQQACIVEVREGMRVRRQPRLQGGEKR
jgi:predicted molibdopterin-dependent oxidoreductase YjgC